MTIRSLPDLKPGNPVERQATSVEISRDPDHD